MESVRIARRIGPEQQLAFDIVAEVTQEITIEREGRSFPFFGGATIILDSSARIRFIISKSVASTGRQDEQWRFMQAPSSARFWRLTGKNYSALSYDVTRALCAAAMPEPGTPS